MDYYNEIDPYCALWLRNLVDAKILPEGHVDERDIRDVTPAELMGYRRCHFFAGCGVWAYALEKAGYEGPCWTGSCPCQPFSAAGKGAGFDDERHLWPDWFWLIEVCRPKRIFGEQVSGKDALAWLDLVQDDMEGIGYSVGAIDTPACSVGAPHIRQRMYWVAEPSEFRPEGVQQVGYVRLDNQERKVGRKSEPERVCDSERMESPASVGRRGRSDGDQTRHDGQVQTEGRSPIVRLGDSTAQRPQEYDGDQVGRISEQSCLSVRLGDGNGERLQAGFGGIPEQSGRADERGPVNGFYSDARWVYCTDGNWRPTGPRSLPMADGVAGRVGKLRAYGNALCAPQAVEFVKAVMG